MTHFKYCEPLALSARLDRAGDLCGVLHPWLTWLSTTDSEFFWLTSARQPGAHLWFRCIGSAAPSYVMILSSKRLNYLAPDARRLFSRLRSVGPRPSGYPFQRPPPHATLFATQRRRNGLTIGSPRAPLQTIIVLAPVNSLHSNSGR